MTRCQLSKEQSVTRCAWRSKVTD